jgi:hypothetical protein
VLLRLWKLSNQIQELILEDDHVDSTGILVHMSEPVHKLLECPKSTIRDLSFGSLIDHDSL